MRESLKQPVVVIFEDLHWIDEQTQALLDLLADSIASARVLLLVNYRPEYSARVEQQELLRAAPARPAGRRRAAAAMLAALLGEGVELQSAQAADHRAHRRQSVLHRGDRAGAVRRGRAGAQWRGEGDALALATAPAADGAGDARRAHRSAVGGAEGAAADARGDRPGIVARPVQAGCLARG